MDRPRIDGNTKANDRNAEPAALPHDAEVARHGQLGARADRGAVDVGNDGERRMSNRGQHCIKIVMESGGIHATGEVCSGAKSLPLPAEKDGANGLRIFRLVNICRDLAADVGVQRVSLVIATDCDDCYLWLRRVVGWSVVIHGQDV